MRLPITIRRTKAVKKEQIRNDYVSRVQRRQIALLTAKNVKLKAVLHRWGLDEGVYGRGASQKAKPPKGAGAVV